MKRGSRHLGKITGQHSCPQFHLSLLGSLASYGRGGTRRRKWESLKITGGQGSHYKPIGCGASGAHAPGPDDEEEEELMQFCVTVNIRKYASVILEFKRRWPPWVGR
jgi:hypothetical protein